MKKLLSIIIMLTLLLIPSVNAEDLPEVGRDKVTIYMFRGDGCGGCEYAIDELNNFAGKYDDYFEVVSFETWYNQNNATLMSEFMTLFDAEQAIPFFVIGDDYHQVGYDEELITAALDAYMDDDYTDIVANEIDGKEHLYEINNFEETVEAEGLTYLGTSGAKAETNFDAIIVVGIIVVVIGGLAFLIFSPKKNK